MDPSELREALINLVFNSVDALPHGGEITLATRAISNGESNSSGEQRLYVEVRDTGIGMDEKTRQRCLEPFFSTKTNSGGSGLGLAMVYGFMQRQQGAIEIDSTPGYGTSMRLIFPVREKISVPAAAPASDTSQQRSLRILCIDDEEMMRRILKDSLTSFNHSVTVASNGNEGLDLFNESVRSQHPFDAVITDLGMSGIDGMHIAKAVKRNAPRIPVVMLTGWGALMKEDRESVPEVDALMGKPPRIKELNELLLRLTASETNLVSEQSSH